MSSTIHQWPALMRIRPPAQSASSGQVTQRVLSKLDTVPGAQSKHEGEPTVAYLPRGQRAHEPPLAVDGTVPAGQGPQVTPSTENSPVPHGEHAVMPGSGAIVLMGHTVHALAPASEKKPGAQFEHASRP
jgi:hypothetical protein